MTDWVNGVCKAGDRSLSATVSSEQMADGTLGFPARFANDVARVDPLKARVLVRKNIGLHVAERRGRLVLDPVVEGLNDVFFEVLAAIPSMLTLRNLTSRTQVKSCFERCRGRTRSSSDGDQALSWRVQRGEQGTKGKAGRRSDREDDRPYRSGQSRKIRPGLSNMLYLLSRLV